MRTTLESESYGTEIPQSLQPKEASVSPSSYSEERPKKSLPQLMDEYDQNRQLHVDQNYRLRLVIERLRGVPERAIDPPKMIPSESLTDIVSHLNSQYRDNCEETSFLISLLEELI